MIPETPQTYYVIGFLVVSNLGVLVTAITGIFKGVWWAAKIDTELMQIRKDVDEAFKKIRSQTKE